MDEQAEVPNVIMDDAWMLSKAPFKIDDSTIEYEFQEYPYSSTNASSDTQYRLWSTDVSSYFFLPSAHLQCTFQVTDTNDAAIDVTDQSALASNGWSLFENVQLRLGDELISQLDKPAKASRLRQLVEVGQDYMDKAGQHSHHFEDRVSDAHAVTTVDRDLSVYAGSDNSAGAAGYYPTSMYDESQVYLTAANPAALSGTTALPSVRKNPNFDKNFKNKVDRSTASQTIMLPLSEVFPLCGQYTRVIKGTKIEVQLNKISQLSEAIFGSLAKTAVKLDISKLSLWIARVKPSLPALKMVECQLAKSSQVQMLHSNMKYYQLSNVTAGTNSEDWQVVHRQSRPSHAIVGFQFIDRDTDTNLNALAFDELLTGAGAQTLSRVELRVNNHQVPSYPYNPASGYDKARIIHDIHKLGGKDRDYADAPIVCYENWAEGLYPIFVFDLSYLEGDAYESRTQSVINLRWQTSASPASNYNVCLLLFSEQQSVFDYASGQTIVRTK